MAGRKVFTSGEILTAADVNSFLMDQSVMVFADSSARSSAIPTPTEGMVTYREDANRVEVYDGSAFGPIGGILQVVSTTKTDTFSTTSGSYVDITGLSASITPSSSSSKILVFVSINGNASGTNAGLVQALRDSTIIANGAGTAPGFGFLNGGDGNIFNVALNHLDSPSSISSLTYKIQIRTTAGTVYVNRRPNDTSFSMSSQITLMEVAV